MKFSRITCNYGDILIVFNIMYAVLVHGIDLWVIQLQTEKWKHSTCIFVHTKKYRANSQQGQKKNNVWLFKHHHIKSNYPTLGTSIASIKKRNTPCNSRTKKIWLAPFPYLHWYLKYLYVDFMNLGLYLGVKCFLFTF